MNAKTDKKPDPATPPATIDPPTGGTALAVVDFGDDAGKGLDNVGKDERTIPFLVSLKTNSPQVIEGEAKFIPGAMAGMILDTSTGNFFNGKRGLQFIPVHRDHNYPEFTPRNLGGGFVAMHMPDDDLVLQLRAKQGAFGKLWTGTERDPMGLPLNGTELTETYYLYGLAGYPGEIPFFPCVATFTSTQIRKYKNFMNRVTSIKYLNPVTRQPTLPPMWAHRWLLQTVPEKNKKGSYYGWNLSLWTKKEDGTGAEDIPLKSLIPRSDPLYIEASGFYDSIASGKAKVDYTKTDAGAVGSDEDEVVM